MKFIEECFPWLKKQPTLTLTLKDGTLRCLEIDLLDLAMTAWNGQTVQLTTKSIQLDITLVS